MLLMRFSGATLGLDIVAEKKSNNKATKKSGWLAGWRGEIWGSLEEREQRVQYGLRSREGRANDETGEARREAQHARAERGSEGEEERRKSERKRRREQRPEKRNDRSTASSSILCCCCSAKGREIAPHLPLRTHAGYAPSVPPDFVALFARCCSERGREVERGTRRTGGSYGSARGVGYGGTITSQGQSVLP